MDIYDVLHINTVFQDSLANMAKGIINKSTEYTVNQNIERLSYLRNNLPEGKQPSNKGLDTLKAKLLSCFVEGKINKNEWNLRDLRQLSYYISEFADNEKLYRFILRLLWGNWKNLFFNGLVYSVMHSWNGINCNLREDTCRLIREKLQLYDGQVTKYTHLKEHIDLFNDAGPQRLATILLVRKLSVIQAPGVLGLKQSLLGESFFSDVVVFYCKKHSEISTIVLDNIFKLHKLARTKQLVCANLVMSVSRSNDENRQVSISKYINNTLGDVSYIGTWMPQFNASEEEKSLLNEAGRLTNLWLTKKVIEVFFEKCVHDTDRRQFWMQYVNSISDFKVVCSSYTKSRLTLDERIGNTAQNHFIAINSNGENAALIMLIRNKILIEFAERASGAVYVYNTENRYMSFLYRKVNRIINSVSDLKDTNFKMLVSTTNYGGVYFYEEGRLVHIGEWQSRMKLWISKKLNVEPGQYVPDGGCFNNNSIQEKSIELPFEYAVSSVKEETAIESEQNEQKVLNSIVHRHSVRSSEPAIEEIKAIGKSKSVFLGSRNEGRIVFSEEGFFFNRISESRKYFNINTSKKGAITGNIWIKETSKNGNPLWLQIIHNINGVSRCVGYLAEIGNNVYYKESKDGVPQLITD